MKAINIVILLTIVSLVTIFSVQNALPVAVSFLVWRFEASLAIVIFLSVLSGILIAVIVGLSGKLRRTAKKQKEIESGSINGDGEPHVKDR